MRRPRRPSAPTAHRCRSTRCSRATPIAGTQITRERVPGIAGEQHAAQPFGRDPCRGERAAHRRRRAARPRHRHAIARGRHREHRQVQRQRDRGEIAEHRRHRVLEIERVLEPVVVDREMADPERPAAPQRAPASSARAWTSSIQPANADQRQRPQFERREADRGDRAEEERGEGRGSGTPALSAAARLSLRSCRVRGSERGASRVDASRSCCARSRSRAGEDRVASHHDPAPLPPRLSRPRSRRRARLLRRGARLRGGAVVATSGSTSTSFGHQIVAHLDPAAKPVAVAQRGRRPRRAGAAFRRRADDGRLAGAGRRASRRRASPSASRRMSASRASRASRRRCSSATPAATRSSSRRLPTTPCSSRQEQTA